MIVRTLIMLAVLSLVPIPACAEYYRYKDTDGVIRFTDNLLNVPEDQRENIQTYKEALTPGPKPETSDAPRGKLDSKGRNGRVEELNSERESLEQVFKDLDAERKLLLESSPIPQETEAYEAYKKRIEAFNEKIKSYEERRKMFQARVDAFNAEIESQ